MIFHKWLYSQLSSISRWDFSVFSTLNLPFWGDVHFSAEAYAFAPPEAAQTPEFLEHVPWRSDGDFSGLYGPSYRQKKGDIV